MADVMNFPNSFDEFAEQYKIVDEQEIYTNGTELIPIFRVKQWLEHTSNIENEVIKAKTKYDQIKAMSVEEMATAIYNGISSDPCDYCVCSEECRNGSLCRGKSNTEIIAEFLESEVQEDDT